MQTGDVRARSIDVADGTISSNASDIRFMKGDRNMLTLSDCMGLNVENASASLHLRCECKALPAYIFENEGSVLIGMLDDGIKETCSRFVWEAHSAAMQLASHGLSVYLETLLQKRS